MTQTFEEYFKQEKAKGRAPADIMASNPYTVGGSLYKSPTAPIVTPTTPAPIVHTSLETNKELLTLPNGQKIHPDDPNYATYKAQISSYSQTPAPSAPTPTTPASAAYTQPTDPLATKTDLQGTYVPDPSYLKFYQESELNRTPEGKIYLKPGVEARWPGAEKTTVPGESPKTTETAADTYTMPDGSKMSFQQLLDQATGKGYTEPAVIDKAAERTKLATTKGLDKTLTEITTLDVQINDIETAIRNRESDLKAQLSATDATESSIQRELAKQLEPMNRKYRDLTAVRGVKADAYNNGMKEINQTITDMDDKRSEEIAAQTRKTEAYIKAYGLISDRDKEIMGYAKDLDAGKTITLSDGTVVKGIKTTDPKTYSYDYDAPDGHTYRVTKDEATGKEIRKDDKGLTYKPTTTTPTDTQKPIPITPAEKNNLIKEYVKRGYTEAEAASAVERDTSGRPAASLSQLNTSDKSAIAQIKADISAKTYTRNQALQAFPEYAPYL